MNVLSLLVATMLLGRSAQAAYPPPSARNPDLHNYVLGAEEIIVGRVDEVVPVRTYESWSYGKTAKYKYTLSRAVVEVSQFLLAPKDASQHIIVFFASQVYLDPEHVVNKISPRDPGFAVKVGEQHYSSSGFPISLRKGERVLLFLYRASSFRYDFMLGSMDGQQFARSPEIEREKDSAFVVYDNENFQLGGKFGVRKLSGEDVLSIDSDLAAAHGGGEFVITARTSPLWEGGTPAAGHRLSLAIVKKLVAERLSRLVAAPRIAVASHNYERELLVEGKENRVYAVAVLRAFNPTAAPLSYQMVKAGISTPKGSQELRVIDFSKNLVIEPFGSADLRLEGSYVFDGQFKVAMELTLRDSIGQPVLVELPEESIPPTSKFPGF